MNHADFEDTEINSGLAELGLNSVGGKKYRIEDSRTGVKHLDQGEVMDAFLIFIPNYWCYLLFFLKKLPVSFTKFQANSYKVEQQAYTAKKKN